MGIDKDQHTEFGGGAGWPQRRPPVGQAGGVAGKGSVPLSAKQQAFVERVKGFEDVPSTVRPRKNPIQHVRKGAPLDVDAVQGVPDLPSDVRAIERMRKKTNGYSQEGGGAGVERQD